MLGSAKCVKNMLLILAIGLIWGRLGLSRLTSDLCYSKMFGSTDGKCMSCSC